MEIMPLHVNIAINDSPEIQTLNSTFGWVQLYVLSIYQYINICSFDVTTENSNRPKVFYNFFFDKNIKLNTIFTSNSFKILINLYGQWPKRLPYLIHLGIHLVLYRYSVQSTIYNGHVSQKNGVI